MPLLQENEKRRYTYADVLEWDEDFRAEIVDGIVYEMSTPLLEHQRISRKLSAKFYNYLEGKTCKVFAGPVGVRLFPRPDRRDNTVLEPDLIVVCDPSKLDERGCNGAPDLVIEILSPSTSSRDKVLKFNLYLEAGVREYWVVEPDARLVQIHLLKEGRYVTSAYGVYDTKKEEDKRFVSEVAPVTVLPGLSINLAEVF
jgi:Uma2 family endonuclease